MKRFLFLLGALFIMQTVFSMADSANDTIWTRKSHYIINFEFSPTHNYFLSRGSITGSRKGVIIFNTEGDTIKVIYESEGLEFRNTQGIWDAHFSRDGKFMVVIWEYEKDKLSHGMLEIFETENWTSVKKYAVPDGYYTRSGIKCLISPDNSIVTAITMDGFYFYDVVSGDLIKHVRDFGHNSMDYVSIYKSFYSADGQYIYFNASDNKLRYLNTQTYQIDYTRQDQSDFVQYGCMTVSKSGNLLANGTKKNELRVISTQTKETIFSLPVSTAGVAAMAFSPDDQYLAVIFEYAGNLKIYKIPSGDSVYNYTTIPPGYAIVGVSISHDQKYIVTSSGKIFLFKFLPTTGVDENPEQKEEIIYPNPTNGIFSIDFYIDISGITKIQLYDLSGRIVKNIENTFLEAGNHNLEIDISNLPIGQYNLTIETSTGITTHKIMVSR